jgi:hypothetical protein
MATAKAASRNTEALLELLDYQGRGETRSILAGAAWRNARPRAKYGLMGRLLGLAFAALLMLALADPQGAAAQSRDLQRRLSTAKSVECTFSTLATGTWDGVTPQAAVTPAKVEASFLDINVDEGTAEAGSAFGEVFISVRYSFGYLHFMQMSDAGPLHLTTILAHETAMGRLKAVHTRHEYSPTIVPGFTSRPEMYIGDCAVTN